MLKINGVQVPEVIFVIEAVFPGVLLTGKVVYVETVSFIAALESQKYDAFRLICKEIDYEGIWFPYAIKVLTYKDVSHLKAFI